ncbi:MAG TPA: hypothetical protein VHT24_11210 [Pseudacidobacterium sp.]|jgi:hypothetical protein|nr:hypothetical protein [Pseudacidobacterium sp.]
MSFEPHKQRIEPGDSARKAEQEPRPAPVRRIEGGTAAREAENSRDRDVSIGRTVHGFTLSARVGKPFRFEAGAPSKAGEAVPASEVDAQANASTIEIKKITQTNNEKLVNQAAGLKEQASESSAESAFTALPGSFLKALFRRRSRPESSETDKS